jgi:hypothetical protein
MNELVERVARSVRRRRFERTGRGGHVDETLPLTEEELDDARAGIAAAREPTDAMCRAADERCGPIWDKYEIPPVLRPRFVTSADWWRTMIDAGLAEE